MRRSKDEQGKYFWTTENEEKIAKPVKEKKIEDIEKAIEEIEKPKKLKKKSKSKN